MDKPRLSEIFFSTRLSPLMLNVSDLGSHLPSWFVTSLSESGSYPPTSVTSTVLLAGLSPILVLFCMMIRSMSPMSGLGTFIGSASSLLKTLAGESAWMVAWTPCPVASAWKSVYASLPLTSPTIM
jgi:hypothetical protein